MAKARDADVLIKIDSVLSGGRGVAAMPSARLKSDRSKSCFLPSVLTEFSPVLMGFDICKLIFVLLFFFLILPFLVFSALLYQCSGNVLCGLFCKVLGVS